MQLSDLFNVAQAMELYNVTFEHISQSPAGTVGAAQLITSNVRLRKTVKIIQSLIEDLIDMGAPFNNVEFLSSVIDSFDPLPHDNKPPREGNSWKSQISRVAIHQST